MKFFPFRRETTLLLIDLITGLISEMATTSNPSMLLAAVRCLLNGRLTE